MSPAEVIRCPCDMNGAMMPDDGFGALYSPVDVPLIVVTAAVGKEQAGCLVGFHCQPSIQPARYWLSKERPSPPAERASLRG